MVIFLAAVIATLPSPPAAAVRVLDEISSPFTANPCKSERFRGGSVVSHCIGPGSERFICTPERWAIPYPSRTTASSVARQSLRSVSDATNAL